jgi:ferritin
MAEISQALVQALNTHAAFELSHYLQQLQAALWFEERFYTGISSHIQKEAKGQLKVYKKFLHHVVIRGGKGAVIVPATLRSEWESEAEVFEFLYDLEQKNLQAIYQVFAKAREEQDFDIERFLKEFTGEQMETIDHWEELNEKIKAFSVLPGLLWHLDSLI